MAIEGHVYINEAASYVGRAEHTVRQWIKRPDFPPHLRPSVEGGRKRLYWRMDQIAGLEAYAQERSSERGRRSIRPAAAAQAGSGPK